MAFYSPFQTLQNVFTGHVPSAICTTGNGTQNASSCELVIANGTFRPCILDPRREAQTDAFGKGWASEVPCESDLSSRADMALVLGIIVGALSLGPAADWFGRKHILFVSVLTTIAFGAFGACFAPTFGLFAESRFLAGIGTSGIVICSFVLMTEIVGPSARGFCGALFQGANSSGIMVYAGLAYLIQTHWRMLSIAGSLLGVPLLVAAALIPESLRWLYVSGMHEEGWKTLRSLTGTSSLAVDVETTVNPAAKGGPGQIMDILRLKPRKLAVIAFAWFVNAALYQVLALWVGSLGRDIYASVFLNGLSELPAVFLSGLLMDRIGRRLPLTVFMMLGGLSLMACEVVDPISFSGSFYLALCGKACITASTCILSLYSTELFPTVVRSSGFGLCTSAAMIGGRFASSGLLIVYNSTLWQSVGLGGLAVILGYLILSLPETLNEKLPEDLEDLRNPKKVLA